MPRHYDIVIIGDFRFPGGTSTAIAAELEAQARAGYRTGLVSVKAPVLRYPHPIHPQIRACVDAGLCDLLDPETAVDAGLMLVHHPMVLANMPTRQLRVEAQERRLIVHQPVFAADGTPFFDWRAIDRHGAALFGERLTWCPVGPAVRAQLEALDERPALAEEDWHNVLDPDAWRSPRLHSAIDVPVIGRHSRPDPLKWPADREQALLVYPASEAVRVRVLGFDPALARLMAPIPANWQVLPFSTEGVLEFLRSLDVYVYFHHPRWVEAFGRGILEAMATGLPVILPHYFQALFGAAAIYATPDTAADEARALHGDPARWRELGAAAADEVRARFAYGTHVGRVARLIGAPTAVAPRPRRRPRTALFMTTNGIGLGHVSRGLAIARRCPPDLEPVFATLSQGVGLIEAAGYRAEYLPFHAYLGADVNRWNHHLAKELAEMVAFYDPSVILFDGNTPYGGLVDVLQRASAAWGVWVRRGFWRPGVGAPALQREQAFDCVIEPADLADILDLGPTSESRGRTRRVPPIQLVDADEALDRETARAELDLPPEDICVLMQLGAGNNFDFAACQQRCLELLLARPSTTVAFLVSPISLALPELPPQVRPMRLFPVARYLAAFDFAVSATGYNSYHELLLSGTPALYVPNEHPQTDDQLARALHAERMGFGLTVRIGQLYRLAERLATMLDPDERAQMRRRMARLDRRNGAVDAARILEEMAHTLRVDRGA